MMIDQRAAFAEATQFYLEVLASVPADRWTDPGLGEWTVRDLAGHASRGIISLEQYLAQPARAVTVDSPAGYFRAALAAGADHAAITQRGREAGAALGDDPAATVAAATLRVSTLLNAADDNLVIMSAVGGIRLIDYLPTRTFELIIHSLDLAAALGRSIEPPALAGRSALSIVADLALHSGQAGDVLLSLTGRRALPAGFSVL